MEHTATPARSRLILQHYHDVSMSITERTAVNPSMWTVQASSSCDPSYSAKSTKQAPTAPGDLCGDGGRAICSALLGDAHSLAPPAGRLRVLTLYAQAPVVPQTAMVPAQTERAALRSIQHSQSSMFVRRVP
jgi:hypothetical protein